MCCQFEFAYDLRDGEGNLFHSVGIVKCREMLEEGRWVLWDLNPGRKPWCWECSSEAERIVRHSKPSQCPRIVAAKNRRARTVRAQQEREQALEPPQVLGEPQEVLEEPPQVPGEPQQVLEEPPKTPEEPPPVQSPGEDEGDVDDSDQDPYFASDTAKYLVWLGQIGSEKDSHCALYVMKIVSRSKNTFKAFALHCSKAATRKSCIGSVNFLHFMIHAHIVLCRAKFTATNKSTETIEKDEVAIFFAKLGAHGRLPEKLQRRIKCLPDFQALE